MAMGDNERVSSLVLDIALASLQLVDEGSMLLLNSGNESITALRHLLRGFTIRTALGPNVPVGVFGVDLLGGETFIVSVVLGPER